MLKHIMNNLLSQKLSKSARLAGTGTRSAGGASVQNSAESDTTQETKSPYFSPRRTRARAQIKIEYEKPGKTTSDVAKYEPVSVLGKRTKETATKAPKYAIKTESGPLDTNLLKKFEIKVEQIETNPLDLSIKQDTPLVKIETISEDGAASCSNKIKVEPADVDEAISPSKHHKWEPPLWKETLENIKLMRKTYKAPVDTMGCHMCFDPTADEKTKRFHILVALMLSSQTKDEVTYDAMMRLKANGLTPKEIVSADQSDLEQFIYPISFYKNKAKYLKKTAQILIDEYDSDIPSTFSGLIKLPGVGPKMGHICMSAAWKVVSGIGVDTHVHRITNRLKWTQKSTADPEHTRVALEQWLPLDMWADINPLLVGFGQTICTPTYPKCGKCANASICPSRGVKK